MRKKLLIGAVVVAALALAGSLAYVLQSRGGNAETPRDPAGERFPSNMLTACADFNAFFGTIAAPAESFETDADTLSDFSVDVSLGRDDSQSAYDEVTIRVGKRLVGGSTSNKTKEAGCFTLRQLEGAFPALSQ